MIDFMVFRSVCKCGWNGPWDKKVRRALIDGWRHRNAYPDTHADSDVALAGTYID